MSEANTIQLKPSAILSVPIQTYNDCFSFIVNGEEFKTSRLVSDLLSTNISKIHLIEPTLSHFTINTVHKGNFSHILKLVNFNINTIPENEIPFVLEVLEFLGNESIEIIESNQQTELSFENIFTFIEKHQKFESLYSKRLSDELDFISTHFNELCETKEEEFEKIKLNNLIRIFSNENLQLTDEDQLLKFVNKLYSKNSIYSSLYEFVFFENVESTSVKEFIDIFEIDDISKSIWLKLCLRLQEKVEVKSKETNRYKQIKKAQQIKRKLFSYDSNKEFSGIFKYLRDKSNGQIENEINVTASSHYKTSEYDVPINVTLFEEQTKSFISASEPNSWLLFDFKKNRIIPTHYTIRTRSGSDCCHPVTWVIEGSTDNNEWETIDQQNDCPYLKGMRLVHTFEINNQQSKEFQYIRFCHTKNDYLIINSVEFYGTLIE